MAAGAALIGGCSREPAASAQQPASGSETPEVARRLQPSEWLHLPTSAQAQECQPARTIRVGVGEVRLICRVGDAGELTSCVARSINPELKDWVQCLSTAFRARPEHRGELIEVPIRWKPEG